MKYSLLLLVFLVTGCAIAPKVVVANERSVLVNASTHVAAITLADAACAKYDRKAKFVSYESYTVNDHVFHYDCIL